MNDAPDARPDSVPDSLNIWGIGGMPEIGEGDDLADLIAITEPGLRDGDVVVVTSKIVSKAEGRVRTGDRDAAVAAETFRVVARRGPTTISETRHGFVLAAAGVDASNTKPGTVLLLPEDPDASARRIRDGLAERLGVTVAVVISDTFGRPWRYGLTDVAIGLAGMDALADLRGRSDTHGNQLDVTVTAIADEVAAAADLVKGKLTDIPVAIVRGVPPAAVGTASATPRVEQGAQAMVRPASEDMFRYGTRDVVTARRTSLAFADTPVDPATVRRALATARRAPAPPGGLSMRFVLLESAVARKHLLDVLPPERVARSAAAGGDVDSIPEVARVLDALRQAPYLVIPCLRTEGAAASHAEGGTDKDRESLLLTAGAGVENVLVSLTAEGLDSCWLAAAMLGSSTAWRELAVPAGWEPVGVVAIGHATEHRPEGPHPEHDDFVTIR